MWLFVRFIFFLIMLSGGVYAVDYLLQNNDLWIAVRQMFTVTLGYLKTQSIRIVGFVSKPAALWLKRMAGKALVRHAMRIVLALTVAWVIQLLVRTYGKRPVFIRLYVAKLTREAFVRELVRRLSFRPDWPRWARATTGVAAMVGSFYVLSLINGVLKGHWAWMLILSVVWLWIVEKLPLIGFEAFVAIAAEKWKPFKDFVAKCRKQHPRTWWWISWLWMKPASDWIKRRTFA